MELCLFLPGVNQFNYELFFISYCVYFFPALSKCSHDYGWRLPGAALPEQCPDVPWCFPEPSVRSSLPAALGVGG